MDFRSIECTICDLNFNELALNKKECFDLKIFGEKQIEKLKLTIRLDSELVDVFAEPSDRSTVNAAAKCLNASVSGPPPATANN